MLDNLSNLIGGYTKTTTFVVGLILLFLAALVGIFEYQLAVNKRIRRRFPEGVLFLTGIVCGIGFTISASIEFYPILLGMFRNSIIGVYGDRIMPHIYTVIPLLAVGILFGVICYELATYSGRFKKWFLRIYRKNHKMYICRNH